MSDWVRDLSISVIEKCLLSHKSLQTGCITAKNAGTGLRRPHEIDGLTWRFTPSELVLYGSDE